MYNKPITSRIKRSPLLKYSPLKNDNEEAIKTKTTKGEDKKEIKTITEKSSYKGKKMSDEAWKALTPKQRRELNAKAGANEKGEIITEKQEEVITPGEDKKVDVTLKRIQEQDVMQPWEIRQQNRATKIASRNVGKAEKRLERMRKRGLEGTERFKAAEARLDTSKETQARVNEGAGSGYKAGTKIKRKEDRVATTGEFSDPEQVEMGARKQEIAEASGITTSSSGQAAGAVDPGSNPFSNMQINPDEYQINYTPGTYNLGSGINKMDSPAKKALTGKQYNLPQHLQEKIKAAPGKMKTPLKKGYFKSK